MSPVDSHHVVFLALQCTPSLLRCFFCFFLAFLVDSCGITFRQRAWGSHMDISMRIQCLAVLTCLITALLYKSAYKKFVVWHLCTYIGREIAWEQHSLGGREANRTEVNQCVYMYCRCVGCVCVKWCPQNTKLAIFKFCFKLVHFLHLYGSPGHPPTSLLAYSCNYPIGPSCCCGAMHTIMQIHIHIKHQNGGETMWVSNCSFKDWKNIFNCPVKPQIPVDDWQEWGSMLSSTVLAYPA